MTPGRRCRPRARRAAGRAVLAGVVAAAGGLAACGETRGVILGDAPIANGADGALAAADAGPPCSSCSFPVAVSGASPTAQQGGDGGTAYTDTCPANQVVIGFQGFLTLPSAGLTLIEGLQAVCGQLSAQGPSPARMTASVGAMLPIRGASLGSPWTLMCPSDEVVVGFAGRSGSDLDQVGFECAAWSAPSEDAGAPLEMGSTVTLPAVGGDGGLPFEEGCPSGEMVRGTSGHFGHWVDSLGLVCGTPTLASSDGGAP
jgi:hypothetical protein